MYGKKYLNTTLYLNMKMDEILLKEWKDRCEFNKECDPQLKVRVYSNGMKHLHYQCFNCGKIYGKAVSKSGKDLDNIQEIDQEKLLVYERSITQSLISGAEHFELLKKVLKEQSDNRKAYFKNLFGIEYTSFEEGYNIYIKSKFWKEKRIKILERDKYQCRICKEAKATEVHHLSYRNLFSESELELISICGQCHGLVHNVIKRDEQGTIESFL